MKVIKTEQQVKCAVCGKTVTIKHKEKIKHKKVKVGNTKFYCEIHTFK